MKKAALTLILISALSASLMFAVQLAKSAPKTITVPDDYSTIQNAVNHADIGDTVFVRKGTYQESNIVIEKSILIVGENRDSTIITSQSSPVILLVNHSQVTITGFTLIASDTQKPTIEVFPSKKTLTGIQIENSQYCNITGNKIVNSGTAIWLDQSSNSIVESNILWYNYYGIDISGHSTNNIIRGNDISSSQVGIRFYNRNVAYNIACANNVTSAYTGLFYYFTSLNFVVGNYIAYNVDAIHFVSSYNNVLHHNNIAYNSRELSEDSSYYDNIRVAKSINMWDDRTEGNYWSEYEGTTDNGIGTTPYILNEFNKDNYPLLEMVGIQSYASYSSTELPYPTYTPTHSPTPTPTPSSSPTISPSPTPTTTPEPTSEPQPEPFPTTLVIASVSAVAIVCISSLVYVKKHKH